MSDLGMVRYLGYAELPAAAALRERLLARAGASSSANGVHLIVVQSADGSLVVGDSHHYAATPDPFAPTGVDELILDELRAVFAVPRPRARRALDRHLCVGRGPPDARRPPADGVRIVMITSGTGASTSFAIAEEVIAELFG